MSFTTLAYCNRVARGRGTQPVAIICHDSPAPRQDPHPRAASFALPNGQRRKTTGVNPMSARNEDSGWLPQLFNWLAMLVLLSLGVLL
jgi:hypothetical protein